MRHSSLARSIVAAGLCLRCGLTPAWSGTPARHAAVAIDDFSYLDTSHEPTDQTAAHQIALALDAEQSLVGVIRRISRTEYTVRFQVHDARNGAVVTNADSGLRMGANYSWSRGAARLVRDRLLDAALQQ